MGAITTMGAITRIISVYGMCCSFTEKINVVEAETGKTCTSSNGSSTST